MSRKRYVVIICAAVFALAARPAQGPELAEVMQQKLVHAQKILAAVVTSDWTLLETESRKLDELTKDPRWMVLTFPEYAKYSAAFVRASQNLRRAAVQRDLEETPKAYVEVTLKCVECHRYLARARIAR